MDNKFNWIVCPKCNRNSRIKICSDTILINFPLYCPKCKQITLVNVKEFGITIIKDTNN